MSLSPMIRLNISSDKMVLSFMALGAILQLGPYFIWHTKTFLVYSFFVLIISVAYIARKNELKQNNVLVLAYFLLVNLIFNFSFNGFTLYLNSSLLLMFSFLLMNNKDKIHIHSIFQKYFALTLLPGLILLFLSAAGYNLPWEPLIPRSEAKEIKGLFYREYWGGITLNNQVFPTGIGDLYRFSGMYEEPGIVGTVSALLLVLNNFKLNTRSSKIILISGFLSLSLAFFLIVGVYLLLKRRLFLTYLVLTFITLGLVFNSFLIENSLFQERVAYRAAGLIQNPTEMNNRTDKCFDKKFSQYVRTPHIFTGYGSGAHTKTGCNVSSWLTVIYNHGIIGIGLILIFYIALFFSLGFSFPRLLALAPFLLVFTMSLYQRPAFFSIWMVMFFCVAVINAGPELFASKKHPVET